jgi:chemotaxis family two-component system sensor kinase Cph1
MKPEIDLLTCDKEPIHLLGKIQSNGCLIAFDKNSVKLTFKSANADSFFNSNELNNKLNFLDLFDLEFYNYIQNLIKKPFFNELYPNRIKLNNNFYNCFISNGLNHFVLEFEVANEQSKSNLLNKINNISFTFKNIKTKNQLYATLVNEFKSLFDFDRIMIYKFDEKGDGEIVAEEKSFGLESFFGLKYPATDIPQQARKLYLTNISRSIDNVNDPGIEIIKTGTDTNELDLSYSVYRSVSPVHIQYLKNMGVTATHAISIIIDDSLWGMVIFHHYSGAKYLDFENRMAAQILTLHATQTIELIENLEKEQSSILMEKICQKIKNANIELSIFNTIQSCWDILSKEMKSCGFTIIRNNIIENHDYTPDSIQLKELHNKIEKSAFIHCDSIKNHYELNLNNNIAGFVRIGLVENENEYLYFWRLEKEKEVNWAGNPEKAMSYSEINNRLVLTPRSSFQLWKENVKFHSIPWTKDDLNNTKLINEAITSFLINKFSFYIKNNHQSIDTEVTLQQLLKQKTEELYRLNQKLQEEFEENKKYQEQLEIAKKAGDQLNHLKSNFIANMSHEIKTPINGILGLANLISKDDDNKEELKEFGGLIEESCKRLINTVNRILSVSKIENKEVDIQFENIKLENIVQDIIKPLKVLAEEKQQHLILIIQNPEFTFITDQHYFRQILSNLISNAIKYTNVKGTIELNFKQINEEGKDFLYFTVEDNGIGIDAKIINKIFDPFFTEADIPRQLDDSSGLGLYLVKNYLEYLNGTIEVKSEKSKGSLFSVKIPLI